MVISLVASMKIREGKMEEAKEALKEVLKTIKATEPGTLEYMAHTVRGVDNEIVFIEKYKDGDSLKAHSKNLGKNMGKFMAFVEPGPPNIKVCFPIE
jgi:quinol monooxygenase YgiN